MNVGATRPRRFRGALNGVSNAKLGCSVQCHTQWKSFLQRRKTSQPCPYPTPTHFQELIQILPGSFQEVDDVSRAFHPHYEPWFWWVLEFRFHSYAFIIVSQSVVVSRESRDVTLLASVDLALEPLPLAFP
jgi:hypothetical protein